MLFGFTYRGEKYYADGKTQAEAKENVTGITNWKRERLVSMRTLPPFLDSMTYVDKEGKRVTKLSKDYKKLPRGERGERHEK